MSKISAKSVTKTIAKSYITKNKEIYATDDLNKNLKINIEEVIQKTWNSMYLNFNEIFDEILDCITLLDLPNLQAVDEKNKSNALLTRKVNVLNNIITQKRLRNVIIDGLILGDINYSSKFFRTNLFVLINQNLVQANPQYQTKLYHFTNNKIYQLFPEEYISLIIKKIGSQLKAWLIIESKKELNSIQRNIIYV